MERFTKKSTLWEITHRYPATLPVFTSNGFESMADSAKREQFGKSINLDTALMLKQLDYNTFARYLDEAIEGDLNRADPTLSGGGTGEADESLKVVGLLPCPVRLPLLESFNAYLESRNPEDVPVSHELKAASMGVDWIQNNLDGVDDPAKLPDLFISAGFDLFFDKEKIGRFKERGVFEDMSGLEQFNTDFDGLDLKDPEGHYSLISVVPAVFLINTKELGDIPVPRSWEDLLDPVFENSVSLPVGDFDLFNGILLNIHKKYGDNGLRALGRSLLESMHPSQMVKSDRRKDARPKVTIMPYFFTKMVKPGGAMEAVWPEDGAIISPIFMLAKKEKAESLKPVVEFFASKEVGEVLAGEGLFPTVRPDVDNGLAPNAPFMWLGWETIYGQDISALISHCETVFHSALTPSASQIGLKEGA